jgi:hypothetical protein
VSADPGRQGPGCNPFGPFLAAALWLALWRGSRRRRRAAGRRPSDQAADAATERQEPPSGSAAAPGSSWQAALTRPFWTPRVRCWRSTADMWADSATVDVWLSSRQLELTPWITGWRAVGGLAG